MFINLTNHPSSEWSEEQLKAAQQYGEVIDIPFPLVDEQATETEIKRLADEYVSIVKSKGNVQDLTVHIMGEQTLCYALISKLQKEGIRCVASCTEHDNFINKQGQKVSTFHFARFREYVPPRTLRCWKQTKNYINAFYTHLFSGDNPFRRARFYSWTALILVLLCEICIILFSQTRCLYIKGSAITLASLIGVLLIISRFAGLKFGPRSMIVSKLLANAIAPTTLGTLYLLTFVIHIGLATNAVLGLYTEHDDVFFRLLFFTTACVLGLLAIIVFFPTGRDHKAKCPQKVFVSGISAINAGNRNLKPLISPLQLAKNESCKMVVLYTSLYTSFSTAEDFKNKLFWLSNLLNYVKKEDIDYDTQIIRDTIDQCYRPFAMIIEEETNILKTLNDEERKKKIREEYKIKFENEFHNRREQIDNLPEIIKLYIKGVIPVIAKQELDKECPTTIDVQFTEAVDYDLFEECYLTLDNELKKYEIEDNILYFNLTPGTGIVGALMALMSINGNRKLYYYKQNSPVKALTEADKSRIPLKSLLSQALENFEAEVKPY